MLALFLCVDIVDACWPCCMLAYLIHGGLLYSIGLIVAYLPF